MVKKDSKKNEFLLNIYSLIEQGFNPSQITKKLNISKQSLYYYTQILKNEGFISMRSKGVWEIVKKISLGTSEVKKPFTNLHALQINFPILEGIIKDEDWEIKERLNHWLPKYTSLEALGGLRIKNNNNKSITVWALPRNIKSLEEIDNLAHQIRDYVYIYFKTKHQVELDKYNCETKNLDIATEDKTSEGMLKKGEKFKVNFNKKAEKIFKNDKIDSSAWIDGSPFNFTAETNDKEWKREYLNMPFNIQKLMSGVMYIAENYKSHIGVVEKLNKILIKPEIKKHIKEVSSSQTKIGDFL